MRIVGFVIVNGQRVPVDWSITGTKVEHSVGLSADNVKVFVNLPNYVGEDGEPLQQAVEEVITSQSSEYDSMTNTDLRVLLEQRGLPTYGNKSDLILRLLKSDAEGDVVEVEEEGDEVSEDAEA
jgi:hypothetical protein